MSPTQSPTTKTMLRRIEQYRDRWSSYGGQTGILAISEKLSAEELRAYEIFCGYDDRFLEKLSPDVSVALWRAGSVLFEQGTYLDLAFFIAGGEVEVSLEGVGESARSRPIFDAERTIMTPGPAAEPSEESAKPAAADPTRTTHIKSPASTTRAGGRRSAAGHEITFLASMDFDLPLGDVSRLGPGELFGEIGAMSGWPQSVTARTVGEVQLVQIRVPALRLMKRRSAALKDRIDRLYKERALFSQLRSTPLFRGANDFFLSGLMEVVELVSCEPDEVVVREGDPADAVYLVRSGFVKLVQHFGEGDVVVSYLSKGMTLGEVEFLVEGLERWEVTATAVEYAELVKIPAFEFGNLVRLSPEIEDQVWRGATDRIKEFGASKRDISRSEFLQTALDTGLVQGTSMLVIDLEACTRCDDCVRACAATHGGRPRFVREGSKVDHLLIARSCYHCRDPVCLVGCPTGAIHRAGVADVVEIDEEICIGCATCASNCPYDAIVMHETGEVWPDDMLPTGLRGTDRLLASKCDLCHTTGHGPACVSNCPQRCAFRVGSPQEIQQLLARK